MARNKNRRDDAVEVNATATVGNADPLPGDTHGLVVTTPPAGDINPELVTTPKAGDELPPVIEPETDDADQSQAIDPVVSSDIPSDPSATVAAAILALGRMFNEAGVVSAALSKHLRGTAGEPELHAFLHRMQTLIGEFRHSFEQIDSGMSDRLRDAVQDAVAA